MPLTPKGEKIKAAMERQYGSKKGTSVFYASANNGTITGVHKARAKKAVTLITDAFATKVVTDGDAARAVTWRLGATGETHTDDAKVIVLAAGAIGSVATRAAEVTSTPAVTMPPIATFAGVSMVM